MKGTVLVVMLAAGIGAAQESPLWPAFSDANPVVMHFHQTPHTGPVPSAESLRSLDAYFAWRWTRGAGSVVATFYDGNTPAFSKTLTGLAAEWQKSTVEFTASSTVDAASLLISSPPSGSVYVDQVSLFSASALATGGYRPDRFKAVADLQPASIRWPGGSFANRYIWQNSLDQPDSIKVVFAEATVEGRVVKFTLPALSAGVVCVTQWLL